jgi:hypothetical protein
VVLLLLKSPVRSSFLCSPSFLLSFVSHLLLSFVDTASKGAVLAMTRELAAVHAREGIRVNALCPGPVRTKLLMDFLDTDEKKDRRLVHVPMGRFSEGIEQAKGALFLASDDSSFVTGTGAFSPFLPRLPRVVRCSFFRSQTSSSTAVLLPPTSPLSARTRFPHRRTSLPASKPFLLSLYSPLVHSLLNIVPQCTNKIQSFAFSLRSRSTREDATTACKGAFFPALSNEREAFEF